MKQAISIATRATAVIAAMALSGLTAATAQTIAITGGTVFPVSGPRIENGTVLIRDGLITAVGANVTIPAGATRVDATGKWVTPGLIHADSRAGLGIASLFQQSEASVQGEVTSSFSPAEGIDPAAITIPLARTGGVTTGIAAPGGSYLRGTAVAIQHAGDRLEDVLISPAVAMVLNLSGSSKTAGGGSRAGTMARTRRIFRDALEYARRRADYQRGAMQELSAPAAELEALLPVLRKEMPIMISANRAIDIRNALRLTAEFELRTILTGAVEAWQVAGEIAAAGVPVVLEPNTDIPSFDGLGARLDNATLLRAAGVSVIIAQGDPGGERQLRFGAGNAVRNGLTWDDALAAITANPAMAFGLTGYGSLAAGNVANVVVWSGDPLDFASAAEKVYVRGQETSLHTRETELLERYRSLPPRR
jgi:imidazolonepropionase-like amidohydrolase